MFARLDDLEGSVEVVVVPAVLAEARELLTADALVLIAGRVDQKGEGETKLVAQAVRAFLPEEGAEEERLRVRVPLARLSATPLDELRRLLADHRGDVPVVVEVETGEGPTALPPGRAVPRGPARQRPGRRAQDPVRGALPGIAPFERVPIVDEPHRA